jgi:hypothetical protein
VPAPNRVTPTGEIVAIDQRGLFLGNRGCLHVRPREIARPWQVRRWITCALEFKGWAAPMWEPRRWTPLFFWDEAVALAAGHRPCALCRRADYNRWVGAWQAALGSGLRPSADQMDRRLHADRLDGRTQRRHVHPWPDLPPGTFVALGDDPWGAQLDGAGGRPSGTSGAPDLGGAQAALVLDDRVVPWSAAGYRPAVERPGHGDAVVLTPRVTVEVMQAGYRPVVHRSAGPTG